MRSTAAAIIIIISSSSSSSSSIFTIIIIASIFLQLCIRNTLDIQNMVVWLIEKKIVYTSRIPPRPLGDWRLGGWEAGSSTKKSISLTKESIKKATSP